MWIVNGKCEHLHGFVFFSYLFYVLGHSIFKVNTLYTYITVFTGLVIYIVMQNVHSSLIKMLGYIFSIDESVCMCLLVFVCAGGGWQCE